MLTHILKRLSFNIANYIVTITAGNIFNILGSYILRAYILILSTAN